MSDEQHNAADAAADAATGAAIDAHVRKAAGRDGWRFYDCQKP
jgi:hypothetical protein